MLTIGDTFPSFTVKGVVSTDPLDEPDIVPDDGGDVAGDAPDEP